MLNILKTHKKNLIIYGISLVAVILDIISKLLVINFLDYAKEVEVIPNFLSLLYVTNTGAAFSSLENHTTLLVIMTIFCIALIGTIINKESNKNKLIDFSLGILLGGMIGNLIDRVFYKKVIDFISIKIFSYRFPVFNIADICITCGVAIYIIVSIINEFNANKTKLCYNTSKKRGDSK